MSWLEAGHTDASTELVGVGSGHMRTSCISEDGVECFVYPAFNIDIHRGGVRTDKMGEDGNSRFKHATLCGK